MNATITYTITGREALRIAERESLAIHCAENPIHTGDTTSHPLALEVAKYDASLVSVTVTPTGAWRNSRGSYVDGEGRNAHDYFRGGEWLGPDDDGIEPAFDDAH